jgi:hypothetical protein
LFFFRWLDANLCEPKDESVPYSKFWKYIAEILVLTKGVERKPSSYKKFHIINIHVLAYIKTVVLATTVSVIITFPKISITK